MAWIKIEHTMPDKLEVDQMAEALDIDRDAVSGKLIRFWIWADQQLRSGCAFSVTPTLIDRLTSCIGFTDALVKVGWLERVGDQFQIPNFDKHNSQTAKNRALAADRMRKTRKDSCDDSVTQRAQQKANASYSYSKSVSLSGLGDARGKGERLKDDVERIYQAYPRKIAKQRALPKIRAALKTVTDRGQDDPVKWLLSRVQAFAASDQAKDLTYCLYPERWFRDGRYDDDDSAWKSQSGTGPNQAHANEQRYESAADRRRAVQRRRDYPEPDTPIPTGLD